MLLNAGPINSTRLNGEVGYLYLQSALALELGLNGSLYQWELAAALALELDLAAALDKVATLGSTLTVELDVASDLTYFKYLDYVSGPRTAFVGAAPSFAVVAPQDWRADVLLAPLAAVVPPDVEEPEVWQ